MPCQTGVKSWSTTCYPKFPLNKYDTTRWIGFLWATGEIVAQLMQLTPFMQRNTNYRFAMPVCIRQATSLYKLARGADYLQCSKTFAIGRSSAHFGPTWIRICCKYFVSKAGSMAKWKWLKKSVCHQNEFHSTYPCTSYYFVESLFAWSFATLLLTMCTFAQHGPYGY